MGVELKILNNGIDEINLTQYSIKGIELVKDNSNLKSNMLNKNIKEIIIEGIILPYIDNYENFNKDKDNFNTEKSLGREVDDVRKLIQWSVISENKECYRDLQYKITATDGKLINEYDFENVYVTIYNESFSQLSGVGRFKMVMTVKIK